MKRSAKAPNRAVQEIRDLKPGRLYSMKMFTADDQDLSNGRSVKQKHAVEINLANVEMLQYLEKRFHQVTFESSYGQEVSPFSRYHQPWLNYYNRLFRAKAPAAKLTILDWGSADEPGGPIGQE